MTLHSHLSCVAVSRNPQIMTFHSRHESTLFVSHLGFTELQLVELHQYNHEHHHLKYTDVSDCD